MILFVDTMNMLYSLHLSGDKQSGIIQLISLFEQSSLHQKAKKTTFIIDGHSFVIPIQKPGIQFVFSKDETADELIIRRAKKVADKRVCVATSDSEIKQKLQGFGIEFVNSSVFKASKSAKKDNSTKSKTDLIKREDSSVWFEKLLEIKFND